MKILDKPKENTKQPKPTPLGYRCNICKDMIALLNF